MNRPPEQEQPIAWRLFLYSLSVAISYIVARTVGDSLFLSRVGNDRVALVFVIAGCLTAVVASSWYWLTKRISIGKSIQLSGFGFALLTLVAWALLPRFHHSFWLLSSIYLLAEVRGCVNAMNVVSVLSSKLGKKASKPSWAFVGLAAPIAGVLVGGLMAYESTVIDLRAWLLIGCAFDVVSFVVGYWLDQLKDEKLTAKSNESKSKVAKQSKKFTKKKLGPNGLSRKEMVSRQLRFWIGTLVCCKVIVFTTISFEWKTAANSFFESDPERLIQFFGTYYGVVGLATIATQYFLASFLLSRKRLKLPILLMPVILLMVSSLLAIGFGLMIGLAVATTGKSLEIWGRSVHDTILNRMYTRIRRKKRRAVIAMNSVGVKPLAEVAAALLILFGTTMIYRSMVVAVTVLWLFAGWRLVQLVQKPATKPTEIAAQRTNDALASTQ